MPEEPFPLAQPALLHHHLIVSWAWTTRYYQNPLPGCATSAGTWGLMLCNCYREILNNLIFECVLYDSSLMEQWNLCQGLGAWVWWGIPAFRHLQVSQDLSSGTSSPLPFCCHPQQGLGVWGRLGFGMNLLCPVVGQGCEVFTLLRECSIKETDGESKEKASCQLCEQEVSFFILHRVLQIM